MHSDWFDFYSVAYECGYMALSDIWQGCDDGWITADEYKEITGDTWYSKEDLKQQVKDGKITKERYQEITGEKYKE